MRLEDKILEIVRANTEAKDEVTLASDLRKELHLDSFGTLMIINALEEAFEITLEEGDFTRVASVSDVAGLLRSKYHCQ